MRLGGRVEVRSDWSMFTGQQGELVQAEPHLMVALDGEAEPLRFGEGELVTLESERHIGGAE